jgi:hypothetical protein
MSAAKNSVQPLVGHAGREARVAWLVEHWEMVRRATPRGVAMMMFRAGLYSPNTGTTDIVRSLQWGNRFGPGLMDRARSVKLRDPSYVPNAPRDLRGDSRVTVHADVGHGSEGK